MLRALDPAHVFPVALTLLTRKTDRLRFKFIFGRRVDPQPSWDHRSDEAQVPFEELTTEPLLVPAMESMWNCKRMILRLRFPNDPSDHLADRDDWQGGRGGG